MSTRPILSWRPKACTRDSSDSFTLRSNPEYEWMMYHRISGFCGGVTSPEGAAASGGTVTPSFSCSCIMYFNRLLSTCPFPLAMGEVTEQRIHAPPNHHIDYPEIQSKQSD